MSGGPGKLVPSKDNGYQPVAFGRVSVVLLPHLRASRILLLMSR